jgi:hypothetical protein
MSHHLLLVDIRLYAGLSGCCRCYRCKWHLKLLPEIGDHRWPLLELKVLLLKVYDRMEALIQHLASGV